MLATLCRDIISELAIFYKVTENPVEGIIHGGMIREQLIAFRRATGLRPERIIFYRDGVSEGQFSEVLLREFDAIRKACVSLENYHGQVWGPKSASSDETAARIAMLVAGERTPVNAKMVKSRYTTGAASLSFTSTSCDPVAINDFEYVMAEKNPKEGYIQLHTTHGDLKIEMHCDIVTPRACENYITLCERGYYNGIAFIETHGIVLGNFCLSILIELFRPGLYF